MNVKICLFLLGFFYVSLSYGQGREKIQLSWNKNETQRFSETEKVTFLSFEGAIYSSQNKYLPSYLLRKKLPSTSGNINARLFNEVFEVITPEELEQIKGLEKIKNEIEVFSEIGYDQKQPFAIVSFIPIRLNTKTGSYEKLVSFEIDLTSGSTEKSARSARSYASNSVLANGNWYKMGVASNGVFKIDYQYLADLGLDPAAIDPRNIRIYGNGGGMLPFANATPRLDDLTENAISVQGEEDGSFDSTDFVLFYGQGPTTWKYNYSKQKYEHTLHLYSDTTYYFLTTDLGFGKRISNQISTSQSPSHTVTSFDDYALHEKETNNLIKSGRIWYGESFDLVTNYNFAFSFPNIDLASPVSLRTTLAARSCQASSFVLNAQGLNTTIAVPPVVCTNYYGDFANQKDTTISFNPGGPTISVAMSYNKSSTSSAGWLNYLELNARRLLKMGVGQLSFRDIQSAGPGNVSDFFISNANSAVVIWETTDPLNVKIQNATLSGNSLSFRLPTDSIREFIAFSGQGGSSPTMMGLVSNQNLHAIAQPQMIIIAHPKFLSEANELAQFHRNDGLTVEVTRTDQVYNEFSSGAPDVSAIRDFMKMLYDRASSQNDMPKYLLLFGDGSYDNKGKAASNSNYILTYQSENSLKLTESYVSDDYFGLLDDTEGSWTNNNELVDIGIGRLPVQTVVEAQNVVNKIKHYYDPKTMKDWRNYIAYVGDDEDSNLHTNQADQLATMIDTSYNNYNLDKIFLDAYPQISTPGGERYPEVNVAISSRMQKGALILNYTGHGGEVGWAHERILTVSEINNYQNINNLPLFVTATCEFSRFDDPGRTSAGELVLLNAAGGGIGLFTTVRLVYASPNFTLNKNFYQYAFEEINGEVPRMGDLFKLTKVASGGSVNNRNFTFLGDPALKLAYPKHRVVTSAINGNVITTVPDTMKALAKVTVTGFVQDKNGQKLTNFNGILYPTVFDKEALVTTFGNDPGPCPACSPVRTFKLQKNIVYKGKVSVKNGDFTFTFVVPKDIAYQYGKGRISYYAENGVEDAHGNFQDFIIGGAAENVPEDIAGPEIDLYMNDDKFVFGGITDENPKLLAYIRDENGVNTVGSGIGHDVTAILDENTDKTIVLNDYYEADMDSYQSGSIRYPFSKLTEGRHTLKLKVWDVYNNSNDAYTEFIVAHSAQIALKHVLNYPNPFTTHTEFYFEHNQPSSRLRVQVQIFTISGKLIKTIDTNVKTEGYRAEPIPWNGLDDFGDKIGKGVYIYRLKVRGPDGTLAEKHEKLVILN